MQESFQNINKYANASMINLSFNLKDEALVLKIIDNGQGFDVSKKRKGIGLQNMLSRMSALNGTLDIASKAESGTTLIFQVPKINLTK
jgi:signal transduction histidine kinase